ncbi:MAG: hypothetical protein ACPLXO_00945 [Desulfurella sp.]|jgi:hypothetical protein
MWLLDKKPRFFNLLNFYKIELTKGDNQILLLYRLNRDETVVKKIDIETPNNAFRVKLGNFLKQKGFLFIETNYQKFIWINKKFVVSITSKNEEIIIETTEGVLDNIEIGNKLQLQLFVVKNITDFISVPVEKEETRGLKSKYDASSISF